MELTQMFMGLYQDRYGHTVPQEVAESIVQELPVIDNSRRSSGERFAFTEAKRLGDDMEVNWNVVSPAEWYLIINAFYSSFYRTAKRVNSVSPEFFASLAFDWFYNVDDDNEKTFRLFVHL